MKKHILILFVLLSAIGYSQNGINYKALIKDGNGNVIANTAIQIQFTIIEDITNVYTETHSPTTDANGIVIVNIGEGTATIGDFNTINWEEENHSLNLQVDTGAGLVDLGTTQFMSVPYAKYAETATNASNVSGLEAIDEGNGMGWRIIGRNATNYDNIGFNAIDLSFVDDPNLGLGASGNYAFSLGFNGSATGEHALAFGNQNYALNGYAIAIGNNNTVSGLNSTAIGAINQVSGDYAFVAGLQNVASENYAVALGASTTASGEYAIAMGSGTTASANRSTAMGSGTTASGIASTAMGFLTTASGTVSTAMGNVTTASGISSTAMGSDTIASGNSSTAMGINTEASGTTSTAMGTNTEASGDNSTAMGSGTEASGSSSTAMGSGTTASGGSSTAIGSVTIASGDRSTAMGNNTEASEFDSTAMGSNTTASGGASTAMGFQTEASGDRSTAMGYGTTASGDSSIAMGGFTEASGIVSTAMGIGTQASAYASTAIGSYNIGGGAPNFWALTDPLFEIGNGLTDTERRNAVTVLKNGNVGIGTSTPQERLHISGGRLRIGTETIEDTGSNRLSFNADLLPDGDNNFRLGNASSRWTSVWATDGTINTSDRREKKNIKNLSYGLAEVLQMQPVSFNWKNKNTPDTKLGLIAQDVLKIVPEVVKTHIWEIDEVSGVLTKKELDRLGVYYSDLVPMLIKAIQEQQKIIETLNTKNKTQEYKLNTVMQNYQFLLSRIENLESNASN